MLCKSDTIMTTAMTKNKKVLYLQAGGPTSVINASFCGLYEEAKKHDYQVFVSPYGLSSLIDGNIKEVKDINTKALLKRPSSYFGSARIFLTSPSKQLDSIIKTLKENEIDMLFLNGGNDTMDSAYKISNACLNEGLNIKVIGIPKTIDNDLKECDHTPGFASAAKYIINATASIVLDDLSYKKGRINIIEAMGRDSGYLALSSALARDKNLAPDLIYIPEIPFNLKDFINEASEIYKRRNRCNIVVSEGIKDENGDLISSMGSKDAFGNIQLGSVSYFLARELDKCGFKTRAIELNVLQRSAFYLTSKVDVNESRKVGKEAFCFADKGLNSVMVSIKRLSDAPYRIKFVPVSLKDVATTPSSIDLSYYDEKTHFATDKFFYYLRPLLGGDFLAQVLELK